MSHTKLLVAGGLMAVALSACGIQAKPVAGTPHVNKAPGSHARLDDPAITPARCLKNHGLHVRLYYTKQHDLPAIQVGTVPSGPTIIFEPTPGYAQGLQITGRAQGAEVINAALLYPNEASERTAKTVETCVALTSAAA